VTAKNEGLHKILEYTEEGCRGDAGNTLGKKADRQVSWPAESHTTKKRIYSTRRRGKREGKKKEKENQKEKNFRTRTASKRKRQQQKGPPPHQNRKECCPLEKGAREPIQVEKRVGAEQEPSSKNLLRARRPYVVINKRRRRPPKETKVL